MEVNRHNFIKSIFVSKEVNAVCAAFLCFKQRSMHRCKNYRVFTDNINDFRALSIMVPLLNVVPR